MPGRILTDQERERLEQFPTQIAPSNLVTYFTLSSIYPVGFSLPTSSCSSIAGCQLLAE